MPARLDDLDLLSRLVAFDTTSANSNRAMADFVAGYAADHGARVERQDTADGGKANLVLRFGPDRDDRDGLVLSGHMDVVPATEPGWTGDPFTLRRDGDRLIARGACDMKGFLMLALQVAAEAGGLDRPLVLLLTHDEEVGTVGARRLVEEWENVRALPRNAIVGEPTRLEVVRLHKGHLELRVVLHGRSAHSGYPHLGRNAIEAAGRVLAGLRGLREELERAGGPNAAHFPDVPFVALNVGTIAGGRAVNVVPDRCELRVGVRLLPGMEAAPLVEAARARVQAAAGPDPFDFEVVRESPPLESAADARVLRELAALVGQEGDRSASYATDAGWLARAGMECAVFGPGSIEVAHRPDEWISAAELTRARGVLARCVGRICRGT